MKRIISPVDSEGKVKAGVIILQEETSAIQVLHIYLNNVHHSENPCLFRHNSKKDSQVAFIFHTFHLLWSDITGIFKGKMTTVVPIYGNGERIGTLIVAKYDATFSDEDLLLAEYAATVLGVQILHDREAQVAEDVRKKAMVQVAYDTLSYSELEAIINILRELNGFEGLLVASKIADRVGITRSVIVNALRKFESAGLIETKSLGMKGTYIRVLNDLLFDELKKRTRR